MLQYNSKVELMWRNLLSLQTEANHEMISLQEIISLAGVSLLEYEHEPNNVFFFTRTRRLPYYTKNLLSYWKKELPKLAGACPAILKIAQQEFDRALSIKFYAEVTKRNEDDNELESLKIMQSAIKRYLNPLGIVHSMEFHNSKEIHRRIT